MSVYMDFNATTPLAPEVISEITESLSEHWANPSSSHKPGLQARHIVDEARHMVASAIGGSPDEVVFTSGGTEANNMVILGSMDFYSSSGRTGVAHVITTDIEHDAVCEPIRSLEQTGRCKVTWLSCADGGCVDPEVVYQAVTGDTCLVSVMMANNETGVLNDVEEIGRLLASHPNRGQIWFHTDSAQTVGKVEVDVTRLGVDFLTVVGHKLYGPRVGALWTSGRGRAARRPDGSACLALLRGGGQERRLRPGTENTPLVRGLGTACRLVVERLRRDQRHMSAVRDLLERRLLESGVAARINLAASERLPNTSSVVLSGEGAGHSVLARCRRLLASTGSACHEQGTAASGVLLRSGVSLADARRTVRLSVGRTTSEADVLAAVADLSQALRRAAANDDGDDGADDDAVDADRGAPDGECGDGGDRATLPTATAEGGAGRRDPDKCGE